MNDFYDRLLVEQKELRDRIDPLEKFLREGSKDGITDFQLEMLEIQLIIMISYSKILGLRIENLG